MFKRVDTKETNIGFFTKPNESMSLSFISRSELRARISQKISLRATHVWHVIYLSNFQQFFYTVSRNFYTL